MALYGTRVRIRGTFTDPVTGAPVDPASVRFVLKLPNVAKPMVVLFTPNGQVVRDGVGSYYFEQLLNFVGIVQYRWESTAVGQESAQEASFTVSPPQILGAGA